MPGFLIGNVTAHQQRITEMFCVYFLNFFFSRFQLGLKAGNPDGLTPKALIEIKVSLFWPKGYLD